MALEIELFGAQRLFMEALEDPNVEQIGYGGARGGGKSYVVRVALILRCLQFPGSKHLLLRRTHVDVTKQHVPDIKLLLTEWGLPFRYNQAEKIFYISCPNGGQSELHLGFAEYVKHAEKYQGIEYLTIAYDEATQFEEQIYDRIGGSARVGVKRGPKIKKILTCNPGGLGHAWVKKRFVTPETRDPYTVWIPSRLSDNVVLTERDPTYGDRLTRGLPDWIKKQWLEGDWDAAEGQYFSLPPGAIRKIEPPQWAKWWAGVDWGFWPSAFAVVWVATWKDQYGRDRAHAYLDMKRHKLETNQQAQAALEMEKRLPWPPAVRWADPATGKRWEGESDDATRTTARVWAKNGFRTNPAKRHGRVPGWMLLRMMLAVPPPEVMPGAEHGILTIDPGCMALLSEITDAVFEMKAGVVSGDDIHASCDDHLLDALRYLLVMVYGLTYTKSIADAYTPRRLTK